MKKLISVLLALAMVLTLSMTAFAVEETTETTEPKTDTYAYNMYYYEGGYGALASRYQCSVEFGDHSASEWFEISYGDPLVAQWPTEVGTHTVTFDKTATLEGVEYQFTVEMKVVIEKLPETSGKCGDNMTWSFDTETYTLTISGTGDMYPIAESREAYSNGEYSYEPVWWRLPVKHIIVEEGVEHLSDYAFLQSDSEWALYYNTTETLTLPTTLKEIPENGFIMASNVNTLTIPEGITSLTGWPFGYPGNAFTCFHEVYLPSTLTELDPVSLMLGCWQSVSGRNGYGPVENLVVHYAGTEEQWAAIQQVQSDLFAEMGLEEFYASISETLTEMLEAAIVFEPKQADEEITVEDGTAAIPDSKVEIEDGKDVVIDVTDTEEEVTGAVIGAETVDKIANAETSVEIKLPDATVSFDSAAMGTIAGAAADSAITIVAKEVEAATLTAEQKAALADLEVSTILTLEVLAGDTKISDFGGGKATITVPFELPEGKTGSDYYVAYIAADGTITAMPTTYAEGKLTFTTGHFSDYVVLEKVTTEPPVTEPPVTEPPVSDNPQTGDSSALMLWVMLMTVSAAALVVCTTKRKAF